MKFSRHIRQAITYRVVSELLWRHQDKHNLRVLETHPGDGLYDCVSMYSGEKEPFQHHLVDFHQLSQKMHVFKQIKTQDTLLPTEEKTPPSIDYVKSYLCAEDPHRFINKVEKKINFQESPKGYSPKYTPATMGFRILAEFLSRHMFSGEEIEVGCGWHDTASPGGSYVREELKQLPVASPKLFDPDMPWQIKMKKGARYWIITRRNMTAIMDLRGVWHFTSEIRNPYRYWDEYLSSGKSENQVLLLIHELEKRLLA